MSLAAFDHNCIHFIRHGHAKGAEHSQAVGNHAYDSHSAAPPHMGQHRQHTTFKRCWDEPRRCLAMIYTAVNIMSTIIRNVQARSGYNTGSWDTRFFVRHVSDRMFAINMYISNKEPLCPRRSDISQQELSLSPTTIPITQLNRLQLRTHCPSTCYSPSTSMQ